MHSKQFRHRNAGSAKLALVAALLIALLIAGGVLAYLGLASAPASANADPQPTQTNPADTLAAGLRSASNLLADAKHQQADAVLAALEKQHPEDPEVHLARARARLGMNDHPAAYASYQAALAILGSAAPPDVHFEAGTVANQAGLTDRALEHFSMAQAADATDPRYPLYLAMIQLKHNDTEPAYASLIRAAKLDPRLAEAWGTLGEIDLNRNRLTLARQHLEKAIALQPHSPKWRTALARLCNREGKPDAALNHISVLDDGPRLSKPALEVALQAYGFLDKPGDAVALLEQAAAANPDDRWTADQLKEWRKRASNAAPTDG